MSTLDAWVTSLSLLAGMFIWTYLTSVFITLLIHMNAASSEYTVKSAALDSFMAYRCLPKVGWCQTLACGRHARLVRIHNPAHMRAAAET